MSDATPYRVIVQHQLSAEQVVTVESHHTVREEAAADIDHFLGQLLKRHEEHRRRAFRVAMRQRDLLQQKVGNLQAEHDRLTGEIEHLQRVKSAATEAA
jgi:hypothetical protein